MATRSRNGFTLVELLVVVAIIAILAAILFPVFMRTKAAAKRTTCLSNFRQVGFAVLTYVDDFNGRYPMYPQNQRPPEIPPEKFDSDPNYRLATGCIWTFRRYVKNTGIWVCPSGGRRDYHSDTYTVPFKRHKSQVWALVGWIEGPGIGTAWTNYSSYPFGRHGAGPHPPGDLMCAQGKTPMEFYQQCKSQGYNPWIIHDSYDPMGKNQFFPHRGGISGVFYDGHAKWYSDSRYDVNLD